MNESIIISEQVRQQFSARATLVGLEVKVRKLKVLEPMEQQVKIAQKTVKYTPLDKLTDGLIAILAGVPVRGYFCWSLMDNFEWAFGTSSRFGLAYTDFETQKRTLKDSGVWFGKVARANELTE